MLLLDLVFSIDSVITAVGMTYYVAVMVAAVSISVAVMLFASKPIYEFVNQHPTVKMLALSFRADGGAAERTSRPGDVRGVAPTMR